MAEPMAYADGAIEVPTGPGMGIAVDPAKIDAFRVGEDGGSGP